MRFYVGTHEPSWLSLTALPLFVSRRRLVRLVTPPRSLGPWSLDSGGFTELNLFGRWETIPAQYAEEASSWQDRVGNLEWAAIQDWMCESFVLGRTGATIAEHQERSVQSYLDLSALAPGVPWAPVLQGWSLDDYLRCAELYASAGVDLAAAKAVGVGSVCRRQATKEAEDIFLGLRSLGAKLHGFGLKTGILKRGVALGLASMDSMAWSSMARKQKIRLPGCTHQTCANCFHYAMQWRDAVLTLGKRDKQMVAI